MSEDPIKAAFEAGLAAGRNETKGQTDEARLAGEKLSVVESFKDALDESVEELRKLGYYVALSQFDNERFPPERMVQFQVGPDVWQYQIEDFLPKLREIVVDKKFGRKSQAG